MDKREFVTVMRKIKDAYGSRFPQLTDELLITWYEQLGSRNVKVFWRAVKQHIAYSQYAPTIAEIRRVCEELEADRLNMQHMFSLTAGYYPAGWQDTDAKAAYRQKLSEVSAEERQDAADYMLGEVKRFVASCECCVGGAKIPKFSEFLRSIKLPTAERRGA